MVVSSQIMKRPKLFAVKIKVQVSDAEEENILQAKRNNGNWDIELLFSLVIVFEIKRKATVIK